MKKINLSESEKDRIRGLHDSYKNEHGTLIKEGPIGARYGVGFKQDMPEQSVPSAVTDAARAIGKAISPQEWGDFWTKAKSFGSDFVSMMDNCDEDSLVEWKKQNTECQMANVVQNDRTVFSGLSSKGWFIPYTSLDARISSGDS